MSNEVEDALITATDKLDEELNLIIEKIQWVDTEIENIFKMISESPCPGAASCIIFSMFTLKLRNMHEAINMIEQNLLNKANVINDI